ncbi:MAG: hypothetical protein ACT4QF_02160 [Sporichthyaceae bacterium]
MSRTSALPVESRARIAAHAGVLLVLAIGVLTFAVDGHPASAVGFVLAFALALFLARDDVRSAASGAALSNPVASPAEAQRAAWTDLYAVVTDELAGQIGRAAAPSESAPGTAWNGYASAGHAFETGTALAVAPIDLESAEERDRRRAEVERVMQTAMHAGYLAAKAGWTSAPTSRVRWTEHAEPVVEFLQSRRVAGPDGATE